MTLFWRYFHFIGNIKWRQISRLVCVWAFVYSFLCEIYIAVVRCVCVCVGWYVYMNFRFTFWWWPFVRQMSYPCALWIYRKKSRKWEKEISLPNGRLHLLNCERTQCNNCGKETKSAFVIVICIRFSLVPLYFFFVVVAESVTYLIIAGLVIIFSFVRRRHRRRRRWKWLHWKSLANNQIFNDNENEKQKWG